MSKIKLEAGYKGKDKMRANALKLFAGEPKIKSIVEPVSASAADREKARLYKKGGSVKKMPLSKEQSDLKLPKRAPTPKFKQQSVKAMDNCKLKRAAGGAIGEVNTKLKMPIKKAAYSKGGALGEVKTKLKSPMKKACYAAGGSVYESQLVGNAPSTKRPNFNYESDMRGVKAESKPKFAAGGVAKIRHKVATAQGKPMKAPRSKKTTST